MRLEERAGVSGQIRFVTWRGDVSQDEALEYLNGVWRPKAGRVHSDVTQRNLVTNAGRSAIATGLIAGALTVPGWIAVGTTAITPAATDTSLTGELMRKACSTVAVLSTYYLRFVSNFTTGDFNNTVRGIALLTAAGGGTMWAIASTNTTKDATQSLVAEWRILVSTA